jgi:hypothetical protein
VSSVENLPRGYVFYRGPSALNGAPIVAAAIVRSDNTKTGAVVQTYMLPDTGERPTEAIRSGSDESVCGDCKHRPKNAGTCYVVVRQGATKVWTALQEKRYPDLTRYVDIAAEIIARRMVRLGTYGDPAAVPVAIWRVLIRNVASCHRLHASMDASRGAAAQRVLHGVSRFARRARARAIDGLAHLPRPAAGGAARAS